jgi:hypothetical protein
MKPTEEPSGPGAKPPGVSNGAPDTALLQQKPKKTKKMQRQKPKKTQKPKKMPVSTNQRRISLWTLVVMPALLLSIWEIGINGELDAGSTHTEVSSRHLGPLSAGTSLEHFEYCRSLEKEQAGECFREMAAMQMVEIAAMASTIALSQPSVKIGEIEQQHPLPEPTDVVKKPSDGAHLLGETNGSAEDVVGPSDPNAASMHGGRPMKGNPSFSLSTSLHSFPSAH